MKKLMLVAAIAVFGLSNVNAQEGFTVGAHVGLPIGDIGDFSNFNYGIDAAYLWNVGEGFDVGVASGYTNFSAGDDQTIDTGFGTITVESESFGFIPIAGAARYSFSDSWFAGADLGYALATEGDGGIYYQPKFGYKTESLDVFAFYKGISRDGATVAAIGVGVGFRF